MIELKEGYKSNKNWNSDDFLFKMNFNVAFEYDLVWNSIWFLIFIQ